MQRMQPEAHATQCDTDAMRMNADVHRMHKDEALGGVGKLEAANAVVMQ